MLIFLEEKSEQYKCEYAAIKLIDDYKLPKVACRNKNEVKGTNYAVKISSEMLIYFDYENCIFGKQASNL